MVDVQDVSRYLDSSAWVGVGVLGILLFVVGIYTPALASFPEAPYLQAIVAIAGGAIAVLGFTCYYDRREYERRHPKRRPLKGRALEIAIAPSLEVYRPGPAAPQDAVTVPVPPSEDQPRP